mmetsp:Transcript_46277/g.114779  ORF Transcript_46277/g.114779 Transcript_46277/m.114779 type:complete len:219 (+) Transcript_46277:514-1170(+)
MPSGRVAAPVRLLQLLRRERQLASRAVRRARGAGGAVWKEEGVGEEAWGVGGGGGGRECCGGGELEGGRGGSGGGAPREGVLSREGRLQEQVAPPAHEREVGALGVLRQLQRVRRAPLVRDGRRRGVEGRLLLVPPAELGEELAERGERLHQLALHPAEDRRAAEARAAAVAIPHLNHMAAVDAAPPVLLARQPPPAHAFRLVPTHRLSFPRGVEAVR